MGKFKLGANIDDNTIFIVRRNDINGRFDPYYYKNIFNSLRKKLIAKGFVRLGTFVESWNRGDGPRDGYYTEDSESGVYFLRVNNLKNHSIELKDVKYVNRAIHETKLKRTQVTAGDVIFAISGTKDNLGTVSIIPDNIQEANLNSALVRFDLNNQIDKKFFCIIFELDFIRTQIEFTGNGAAQNNLNNNEINSFLLPNLAVTVQKSLVQDYEVATYHSEQKEKQAQALLDGIDGYLLNELGITLPEQDNRLEKRIFTVPFRNVIGRRLDAPVQRSSFSLLSSKYPMSKLVREFEFNPNTVITSQFCSFIPMEKISDNEGVVTSSEETLLKAESNGYTRFAENDLLWARITPCMQNGKSAVATNLINGFGYGSTEYFVFRARNDNNIHYLHALLRTRYVREAAMFYFGGATGHQRVSLDFFNDMLIPLPPLEKQNEIATHISNIRAQAKRLQSEAAQGLSDAKAQIERMILGDAA